MFLASPLRLSLSRMQLKWDDIYNLNQIVIYQELFLLKELVHPMTRPKRTKKFAAHEQQGVMLVVLCLLHCQGHYDYFEKYFGFEKSHPIFLCLRKAYCWNICFNGKD